jgi:hypothetical protein
MGDAKRIEIVGGNTRNETVQLGNHEDTDTVYGGAFLVNCEVNFWGTNFEIVDANFLNCRINAKVPIENVQFLESVFERSAISGKFVGCGFGFRRGVSKSPNAYYRNCDFSSAVLDHCLFFTGDTETVTWPSWPNITILNPRQNEKDFASNVFPANLGSLNETINNAMKASTSGGADELLALTIDLGRDVENLKPAEVSLAQNVFAQKNCIRF